MLPLISRLASWGPVFFGLLLFAPVAAAVLDASGFSLGVPNLLPMLLLGGGWGVVARYRGRWL